MPATSPKRPGRESRYHEARSRYECLGIDTDAALKKLSTIPISLHCWQGDDVGGFENSLGLSGGILATGNYPGKATTPGELRADMDQAFSLVPGKHRVNLHAIYADTGMRGVERSALTAANFAGWIDWARSRGLGLDFNPTYFSHPRAASGFTLSSTDASVRKYWIEHGIACRRIGAHFGKALGTTCVTNFWIPDGYKDACVDRTVHRELLVDSLDRIFSVKVDARHNRDAVESKLFGIGSESYVTGSHEFYLGYAVSRKMMPCLDMGHFHPTESIADKISSLLLYVPELLLHVSRGIRWDSDHVVIFDDEVRRVAEEIVRSGGLGRVHIALDYFDASINRIAAWVIGMRGTQKALLAALLQPHDELRSLERAGDFSGRLALLEDLKTLPLGDVWDRFCEMHDTPPDTQWFSQVKDYERTALSSRVTSGRSDEPALLDDLALASHFLGLDNDYVQVGGGNTSIKSADRSRMYIKASGSGLADMSREQGWVCVDLAGALSVLKDAPLENLPRDRREEETKKRLLATVRHPADRRPSVETFLHAMLDTVVMHSHPVAANALNCHPDGEKILAGLNREEKVPALWVPYVDPGIKLAFHFSRLVAAYRKRHGRVPRAVFLENHGFICAGPTVAEAMEIHLRWMSRLEEHFETSARAAGSSLNAASKALSRAMTRRFGSQVIVRPAQKRELADAARTDAWRVLSGALTPDHIVYEGAAALCMDGASGMPSDASLDKEVTSFAARFGTYPRIAVIPGIGIFIAGDAPSRLDATEVMAVSALRIAQRTGGAYRFMARENVDFITNWEVEKFRAAALTKPAVRKK